jgi:hypothetical protein
MILILPYISAIYLKDKNYQNSYAIVKINLNQVYAEDAFLKCLEKIQKLAFEQNLSKKQNQEILVEIYNLITSIVVYLGGDSYKLVNKLYEFIDKAIIIKNQIQRIKAKTHINKLMF